MKGYKELNKKERDKIIYDTGYITTPFRDNIKVIYSDYIASGRPSPIIEDYIRGDIYPFYSNTHSNAYCGIKMKEEIENCKNYIRRDLNLDDNQKIIFTGSGTTGCVNHMLKLLDMNYKEINIIISLYEHYSNYLPWIELMKKNKNIRLFIVPLNEENNINCKWLKNKINELSINKNNLTIVSITACSNISGIRIPIEKISGIIKRRNKNRNIYYIIDYACNGPYDKINGKISDCLVLSPHKFIGGVSTPGILIINNNIINKDSPYAPGGGCVKESIIDNINDIGTYNPINKESCPKVEYIDDIEKREIAGTPNIIGIIRIKQILLLKNKYLDLMKNNERILTHNLHKIFSILTNEYKNLKVLFLNKCLDHRLPIISISIDNLHYNLIVALLNDLFGIQTRGGIACCGIFGQYIKENLGINGWCRISFHWLMTKKEINYILNAILFIVKHGEKFKRFYYYNNKKNLFYYNHQKKFNIDINKLIYLLK